VAPLDVVETAPEICEFPLATHENTGRRDHLRSADWWSCPVEAGVLVEDPAVERAKLWIRLDAELVDQALA
jgi:hypothetical protein